MTPVLPGPSRGRRAPSQVSAGRGSPAVVPGPGFRCGANEGLPCAWGAVKVVLGLSRIPAPKRTPLVSAALDAGVAFLLSHDPAVADYPMGFGNTKPNGSWFRLGFPSGYVADVLQVLEALCAAGVAGDARLGNAVKWLLAQQDEAGRWSNRYAYAGKLVRDIDRRGKPEPLGHAACLPGAQGHRSRPSGRRRRLRGALP